MKVNICGVPYKVKYKKVIKEGQEGICEGLIAYRKQKIYLRKNMPKEITEETLTHEILHGILTHMGKNELTNDEEFVQGLANAIYQSFKVREVSE